MVLFLTIVDQTYGLLILLLECLADHGVLWGRFGLCAARKSPVLMHELHLIIQPALHLEVPYFWPWKIKPRFISKFVWTVMWPVVLQCKRYQVEIDPLVETSRALKGEANHMAQGKAFWFCHFNFNIRSKGSRVLLSLTMFSCTQVFFKFLCQLVAVKSLFRAEQENKLCRQFWNTKFEFGLWWLIFSSTF